MVSYLSLVFIAVFATLFAVISFFIRLFTPPRNFPKNIPTIPFYYALLPLFKDVDQSDLYRDYLKEPLKKHGAVKLFFGGQWNVLVTRPAYIAEILKHEDVYAKSGNNIKIPHALVAEYTGENIISSHGEKWKLYQSVIKPALQADQDSEQIWKNSRLLKDLFVEATKKAEGKGIPVYPSLHRHAMANLSDVLYTSSFETLQTMNAPLHQIQTKIKPIIFNPIYLNFPFLDHLPIPIRQLGRELNKQFRKTLRAEITKGHTHHTCNENDNRNIACRLIGSHREGILNDKDLEDNFVSTFLAGHENPQLSFLSLIYLLGLHPEVQDALRKEINTVYPAGSPESFEPEYHELHDLPLLTSTVYEALRLFPPISQLCNRRATENLVIGNKIPVTAGTYLGYNSIATNRDEEFWGEDAEEFKPARWGANSEDINHLYRRANSKGAFISFHGGRRACLGQKFALQELRIGITELLRNLQWRIDEKWDGRMSPAGPLYPRNLTMKFETLDKAGVAQP